MGIYLMASIVCPEGIKQMIHSIEKLALAIGEKLSNANGNSRPLSPVPAVVWLMPSQRLLAVRIGLIGVL